MLRRNIIAEMKVIDCVLIYLEMLGKIQKVQVKQFFICLFALFCFKLFK